MHCLRFLVAAFCCTLLILSGTASRADAPKASQNSVPAYLDYTPFDWEDFLAITRQELLDGLHKTIRVGLDKAQAADTYKNVVQLNDPAQINALKALLRNRHNMLATPLFGEPRLLFEADGGETQIFVTASGIASQGSEQWRMSAKDFAQLKQILDGVYGKDLRARETTFKGSLRIYYLPYHSETLMPATEETIMFTSGRSSLSTLEDRDALLDLLQHPALVPNQAAPALKIDDSKIRLRVEEAKGKHLIFVDNDGVVDDAGQTYKLTPDADKKLGQLIDTLEMEAEQGKRNANFGTVKLSQ